MPIDLERIAQLGGALGLIVRRVPPDQVDLGHIPWSTLLLADATTQWLHVDHERNHLVLVPAEAVPEPA